MLLQKLYVRIWLAVVLAVAVVTLLAAWAWRLASEPPLREVVVRNASGEVIGSGHARKIRQGDTLPPGHADSAQHITLGVIGNGPQFLVQMQDGQTIHLHLPREPQFFQRAPFGFFGTLSLVAIAVAFATYPIVRRLTRRLEALRHGVERWGDGDLSARVPIRGDDEVGFLATRFNYAAQQIEALVKSRESLLTSQKSLLANASHELRSPLTRIRMGLELIDSAPSAMALKEEISRNVSELDALIEEILLASRLDAQEADLGTVEPVDLVGLAAEECARGHARLEVTRSSLVVPGIAKLLRRAIRNLLENAHRYAAGEVTVKLLRDADWAIIQVCDRGRGVPESLRDRIFEPFYRLTGASEQDGGVGLGLSLVKSIALRHAGQASCHNLAQGGACFEIRLPCVERAHQSNARNTAAG